MELDAVESVRMALMEALVLALPILGAGLIIGLIISLFQAVTQIQEQTLSFAPKVVIFFGILALGGGWIGSQLLRFTFMLFDRFPALIK